MTTANSRDTHSVGLRLVRRSNQAITDVTLDPVSPGRDSPAGLVARVASDGGGRYRFDTRAPTLSRDRESLALSMMVDELGRDPGNLLQRLVDVVTGVLGVETAAVAMTEGSALRWDAVAGPMAGVPRWTGLRRMGGAGRVVDGSPALGDATNSLMALPYSVPPIAGSTAIPLHHDGAMVGVLWFANRDGGRTFTASDERVVRVLAQLASSAWITWARGQVARRASDRKGDLLALVSHELRNPLNTIAAAAALLRNSGRGGDHDATAVEVIARQCQFMSRLVTDLFDTARLDHGKLDLQIASIDVRAVVAEAVAARRPQIERYGHTLSLDLGEEPLRVDADPTRLVQMLSNLVDNAVKYTARGGHIGVSLGRTAGEIRLAVTDSGAGLLDDQLARIFEPFAQLDSSTRAGGGLGLGLPLARRLAELHGGSLHASSPGLGHGSSFVITLPAGAVSRSAPSASSTALGLVAGAPLA